MTEDRVELTRKRAELVENLTGPLPPEDRVRIQGALSVINAQIKALNTTEAARLKAAADRRKAAGLAEAQANAARARANASLPDPNTNDADPAQAKAIDDWIATVLVDSGVPVRRTRAGLDFGEVPTKWLMVLQQLYAGIHAVARGEELPDGEARPPAARGIDICAGCGDSGCFNVCCHPSNNLRASRCVEAAKAAKTTKTTKAPKTKKR